jgi:D-alanyl-D-alanine carboxypeptidase/D-alanyl-D-alanine-endopeptidase (penicillin-binding protein 4)
MPHDLTTPRTDRPQTRRRGVTFAVGVSAWLLAAMASFGQSMEAKVRAAIANGRLGNASVDVSVIDVQTGRELVDVRVNTGGKGEERGLIPASNHKLLSSGAALLELGPDFEFRTDIRLVGNRLVVEGAGDPAFGDPDLLDKMKLSVDQFVDRLVESVKKAAPDAKITEVIVDDRIFDRQFVHPDWPANQLHLAYCAQVSGMNFHANVLNVFVTPGAGVGAEAGARAVPSGNWITIRRLAKTVGTGNTEVWLERDKAPYSFRLHGTVRTAPGGPVQVTVNDPGEFFARVLADRVRRAGMGGPDGVLARTAKAEEELGKGRVVATVRTPISVVMDRCNVDSDNLYAEALTKLAGHKATGQPGSWASGTSLIRMKVREKLGPELASSLVLADGCGLSRNNRVSAGLMTRWLRAMANDQSVGEIFVSSLALAGEEGTLRRRFKANTVKNEVRGKSGYIRQVRTLSGYVTHAPSGRRAAFAVLINNVPSGADARAKNVHEEIVEIVDDWVSAQARSEPSAAPKPPGERLGG